MSGGFFFLAPILLAVAAISLFLLLSWLFDKRPQRYKAHMLFKEVDQSVQRGKKKEKQDNTQYEDNNSIFDLLLMNFKPLRKFSPALIIHDARKHEWDLTVGQYYLIYFMASSSFSLLLYIYLNKNMLGLIGFVVGIFVPRIILYYKKKRYAHLLNDRIAVYMKTMANSMSVLGNVVDALNETIKLVHPSLKPDLLRVVSLLQSGKTVTYSYEEMCKKYDFNDFVFFHEMLEVAHDSGGEYMDILMKIAEDFEQRKLLQAKLDTSMSQAKKAYIYNSIIFAGLPFIFYFFQRGAYNMLMETIAGPIVIIMFACILLGVYYKVETLTRMESFKNQ
ncbi:type II secretion system F family protein [Pseudobacillus badius]|uniref:type II secretion system F family protein n=1 Tax=Bacillus badius TaxID=1455 RepID=UPI003D3278DB